MAKYCAFWYPTIYHTSLKKQKRRDNVEVIISDFGKPDTKLKIKLEKGNKEDLSDHRLIFSVEDEEGSLLFSAFELICEKTLNNGIVIYRYDSPNNYPINAPKKFEECLDSVFYHHAKAIFHNHEVQAERDCAIKAALNISSDFDSEDQIKETTNKVIFHYLCQFEDIFRNYAEKLSGYIKKRDALILRFEGETETSEEIASNVGYKELIAYGSSSFKKWFKKASREELNNVRKDAYRYSRYLKSKRKFRKKKISYYSYRLLVLHNYFEKDIERKIVNPRIAGIIANLTKTIIKLCDPSIKWGNVEMWLLHNIDIQLLECEVYYGACIPQWSSRKCYKTLKKTSLDLPRLTHVFRQNINRLCESVLTEYVYCKTLLESKYNLTVDHNSTPNQKEELADKGRKIACNIRNSIRYAETVRYRNSNAQSNSTMLVLDKADKLSSHAEKWTVVGVVLTVIGLLLTFSNFSVIQNFVKDLLCRNI